MAVVTQASNFTPGQVIKCVATDAVGLTKGKLYTVLSVRDGWIQVVTDFGVESSYAEGRFRYAERDVASNIAQAKEVSNAQPPNRVREQTMLRLLNRCRGNRQVILIVEDNRDLRALTSAQLRGLNYIVLETDDADQAQDILRSNPTIDLLFTDLVLPEGKSGFELARSCQADWPNIKILLTTGFPMSRQARDAAGAAEWPLIGKPYGLLELASQVANLFIRTEEPLFLGPYLRKDAEPLFLGPYLRHV